MSAFQIDLAAAGGATKSTLNYVEGRLIGKKQPRFQNRVCLQPEIEIKDYICTAVVDWVRVTYRTTKPTQWRWIQHEIEKATSRKLHVDGRKLVDETQYREFEVTFQEPMPKLLTNALHRPSQQH